MEILKLSQVNGEIVLNEQELAEGKVLIEVKPEDFENGFAIIFIEVKPEDFDNGPVKISIDSEAHIKKVKAEAEAKAEAKRMEIPGICGHPNCRMGDCNSCHNVACGIYQGYEEAKPEF